MDRQTVSLKEHITTVVALQVGDLQKTLDRQQAALDEIRMILMSRQGESKAEVDKLRVEIAHEMTDLREMADERFEKIDERIAKVNETVIKWGGVAMIVLPVLIALLVEAVKRFVFGG